MNSALGLHCTRFAVVLEHFCGDRTTHTDPAGWNRLATGVRHENAFGSCLANVFSSSQAACD